MIYLPIAMAFIGLAFMFTKRMVLKQDPGKMVRYQITFMKRHSPRCTATSPSAATVSELWPIAPTMASPVAASL
jgi:hypothetical protein